MAASEPRVIGDVTPGTAQHSAIAARNPPVPTQRPFPDESLGPVARVSQPLPINSPERRALQRLVSGAVPQGELASLIKTIVSKVKAADIVELLQETDARMFIDVMDEVRTTVLHRVRGVDSSLSPLSPGIGYPQIHTGNP